ncbi:MAG: DMT family transporter [Spirochaetes bacterium]|nr:DMT family transporter [Spirochaetota bacterium]
MWIVWLLVLFALAAGGGFSVQSVVNHNLRVAISNPVRAAFISFLTGTLVLFAVSVAIPKRWPDFASLMHAPWWIWTGGIFGVAMVLSAILVAPRLGTAVFISLIVTGQLVASLFIDHYGFLGIDRHPISIWRVCGAAFLLAGVVLIRRF